MAYYAKFLCYDATYNRASWLTLTGGWDQGTWSQTREYGISRNFLFPTASGTWARNSSSGMRGGSRHYWIDLFTEGQLYATMPHESFIIGRQYKGTVCKPKVYPSKGDFNPFDLKYVSGPSGVKNFNIWISGGFSGGYGPFTGDGLIFTVKDLMEAGSPTAKYVYAGAGLALGLPIKALPKKSGGVGLTGDPNKFAAQNWRTVFDFAGDADFGGYSLGATTAIGSNYFHFGDIYISSFSTGQSWALPSLGGTTGYFKLWTDDMAAQAEAPHSNVHGRFGRR